MQHKDIVIRNICLYVDYHTAEDLCQETFIRLQKYLDRVKPAKIVSWLIVVSEHLAMDHLKKGGQYTTVPGLNMADAELLEFCSDPAEIVLEREDSRKRLRVLERLRRTREYRTRRRNPARDHPDADGPSAVRHSSSSGISAPRRGCSRPFCRSSCRRVLCRDIRNPRTLQWL